MTKTYEEIISIIRRDIEKLEQALSSELAYPNDTLNKILHAPAKRIRPAIAFLLLKANNKDISQEDFDFQIAIELAHTASLIHDDVIDESSQRRGVSSMNSTDGNKLAILAGDYLLSIALKKIINQPSAITKFLNTFTEMALGEINQLLTKFQHTNLETYLEKTHKKTAELFALALHNTSSEFGLNFGLAFQIHNDLKDIDEDIKNGIYTAPVIFSGSTNVSDVGIQKTKDLINYYLLKAKDELNKLPPNEYTQALFEILELYKQ